MSIHKIKINSENENINEDLEIINKNINKGNWFVKYYASWCPHCVNMQTEWDNLEKHDTLKKNNINIAEIEESFFKKLNFKPDIVGYPTIKLYNNGDGEDFQGERSTESMANFLSTKQNGGRRKKRTSKNKKQIKKNKLSRKSKKIKKNPKKNRK